MNVFDFIPDGFFILENLRSKTNIDFKAYKMGIAELKKYSGYTKTLEMNDKIKARTLIENGKHGDVLSYMLDADIKLEQEIIGYLEKNEKLNFPPQSNSLQVTTGVIFMKTTKSIVFIAMFFLLQIALFSCATKPDGKTELDAKTEPNESEILELKNIELNGTNWIKTRFVDKATKKPIASRRFVIYVIFSDDRECGEIIARSDENGWLYVRNIPDGECFADVFPERDENSAESLSSIENSTETYVISRNGRTVTATADGKPVSYFYDIDRKNPTLVLAAFFASYLSKTDGWKKLVADDGFYIPTMQEAYEKFYGVFDSISVTISGEKFDSRYGFFTVKISYSYNGESGEGEDEATLVRDEKSGEWFVEELPR